VSYQKERRQVNAGQLAALIAAAFWAVLVCAAVYVLVRLARLVTAATRTVTEYRDRSELMMKHAQAVLDRTNEQLARTDAITSSMDQVTANMAELSGHVTDLASLARSMSAALGAPLLRIPAVAFGVRRAVAMRRPVRVGAAAAGSGPAAPGSRPATAVRAAPTPAGQPALTPAGQSALTPAPKTAKAARRPARTGGLAGHLARSTARQRERAHR
jgi:uncharacterized protein YoxC